MKYSKLPISISEQIDRLKQRGMTFSDEAKAAHYLSNISFYRLRAYTYPFQDNSNPHHPFLKPVAFEQIISLYVFDRRLRILVFDAIEKIEIALRTKIIYEFALKHGSHWHENPALYRDIHRFNRDILKMHEEVNRSTETFIKHYKNTYTQPPNPPAWMSLEVVSLGMLSKLFENLQKGDEKKTITKALGLTNPVILESWMHTLSYVRNVCAHHARLWNRRLTTMPTIPRHTLYPFLKNPNIYPNKLYATLCCITYILQIVSPGNNFNSKFRELMKSCKLVDLKEMGIPDDWETEPLWQENE